MSALSHLNDAIYHLEMAEEAMYWAKEALPNGELWRRTDNQFEVVGDAATILKNILAQVEQEAARKWVGDIVRNVTGEGEHA